jgi:predicted nucleotidyltransferase
MQQEIQHRLSQLEQEHDIHIFYACETGSRAWGFASTDSDYDVRFLYHRPLRDYLDLFPEDEHLNPPIEGLLDITGWDLRKTLRLIAKSNAALQERLQSPVLYRDMPEQVVELRALAAQFFSPRGGGFHYLNLAKTAYEPMKQTGNIKLKSFFYVLRSLLACHWIGTRQSMPPMTLEALREPLSDTNWNKELDELLALKAGVDEAFILPAGYDVLHDWITDMLYNAALHVPTLPVANADRRILTDYFLNWMKV